MADTYEKVLELGRPDTIKRLFPHSKALLVSGKVIDRAMLKKGNCMTIAANCRNYFVLRGVLLAAQKANAAIILEIAKSESNYCHINMWNLARYVDTVANELGITVPLAIHADHFTIKSQQDVELAKKQIPSLFEFGITSIAIDASHLPDRDNLLANIELAKYVPSWAGYETEVGEIKGKEGLSTPEEALFLIKGLNANNIFPDWIALNNGTTHGIQDSNAGIQVDLTAKIHEAIAPYGVSGAQHGTSGNNSDRLREIATKTTTTKANVATALQMLAWGVKVDEYGNAVLDDKGELIKEKDKGVTDELWQEMVSYAKEKGWPAKNYKWLNLPFEMKFLSEPKEVRERMTKAVEDFVYDLLVNVFYAQDSADIAKELILEAGSFDLGPKAKRIENPEEWTIEKIKQMKDLRTDVGTGDYDD
ncbi:fructose-bisphosphate aldolase [Desulfonauticus submarinus]|uniref:Fructose-bisphosphate aldolase n=1 Tax=Desulfonauticus submarinus TaxID=206665 RepID=A0A1H0CPA4_9BACT|nr:class II fructose-bisphosphate aldolase [Desulfonauticus submarinus]SDN59673.1 fructose-bisphosphate aldolase [Desulfonauticus submarinus]